MFSTAPRHKVSGSVYPLIQTLFVVEMATFLHRILPLNAAIIQMTRQALVTDNADHVNEAFNPVVCAARGSIARV